MTIVSSFSHFLLRRVFRCNRSLGPHSIQSRHSFTTPIRLYNRAPACGLGLSRSIRGTNQHRNPADHSCALCAGRRSKSRRSSTQSNSLLNALQILRLHSTKYTGVRMLSRHPAATQEEPEPTREKNPNEWRPRRIALFRPVQRIERLSIRPFPVRFVVATRPKSPLRPCCIARDPGAIPIVYATRNC